MIDHLGFAVIGTGRIGLRRIRALAEHPRANVVAVYDNEPEIAAAAAATAGCAPVADVAGAIASPNVDCVVVAVPNKFHLDAVTEALAQGRHVLCEKPLARRPDEAIAMVRAAVEHGRFLKVGSNLRHFPNVRKALELAEAGAIGEVMFLRGWIGNDGWSLGSWWRDPDIVGGGTFLDNGCHLLDLARSFLGEPQECTGFTSTLAHAVAPLEDNGMGIFRFEGDRLAFVHASWTEWAEYMYAEVYGTEGYLRIDCRPPACSVVLGARGGAQEVYDFSDAPPVSFALEVDDFVLSIADGRQPQPSGFDGMRAVQMAHAVYEASRSGKAQSLWGREESELKQAVLAGGRR